MKTTIMLSAALVTGLIALAGPAQAGGPPEICIDDFQPCIDVWDELPPCAQDRPSDCVPDHPCITEPVSCVPDPCETVDCDIDPCDTIDCDPEPPCVDCIVEAARQLVAQAKCMVECGFVDCVERYLTDHPLTLPPPDC